MLCLYILHGTDIEDTFNCLHSSTAPQAAPAQAEFLQKVPEMNPEDSSFVTDHRGYHSPSRQHHRRDDPDDLCYTNTGFIPNTTTMIVSDDNNSNIIKTEVAT